MSYTGPNVPGSAISYRLNVIRKEGAALGLKLGSSPSGKTNGTAVRAARNDKPKGNGRKRQETLSDDPRCVASSRNISSCTDVPATIRTPSSTMRTRRAPRTTTPRPTTTRPPPRPPPPSLQPNVKKPSAAASPSASLLATARRPTTRP